MTRAAWMLALSVLLGLQPRHDAFAQTSTRELTAPQSTSAMLVRVELQPPRSSQPRTDSKGRRLFLMDQCVDDDDVTCFPPIKVRLDPASGDLSDVASVMMWLMTVDGSATARPVAVLPGQPPGTAHWQLGQDVTRYTVVQWQQAHPPSLRATEQTFRFRVSFDGGKGESAPFRLIQLP